MNIRVRQVHLYVQNITGILQQIKRQSCIARHQKYLIDNLYKVKHWKIYSKSFEELENVKGTWYIDPPYKFGGEYYHSSTSNKHIDYEKLAEWCLSRNGEIIVCENDKADWLDFKPLVELNGQLHKTMEVIYYKNNEA